MNTIRCTLGEALTEAFQSNMGKVLHGTRGLLEMKIVRGEEHDKLTKAVVLEQDVDEWRMYFTDFFSKEKTGEPYMRFRKFGPVL